MFNMAWHIQFKDSVYWILGRSCVEAGNDDRQWLQDNFGKFYVLASYKDFVTLKNNFNGVSAAF